MAEQNRHFSNEGIQMVNRYMKKMLNTTIHERNANQNHNESSSQTYQNGYHQKDKEKKVFVKAVYCHPAYLTSMQSTS